MVQPASLFGRFRFDEAQLLLYRDEVPVPLGNKAALLLGLLLRHRGSVVSKDELVEAGWHGQAIEESNLSVQIANLRRVLGQTPAGTEWIITVQRIGYRFIAAETRRGAGEIALPTVAILEFADLGVSSDAIRQAAALRDDFRTALTRFRSLTLVASDAGRNSADAADPPGLARRLGVDYLIDGSIRSEAGLLRINLRLIEGNAGRHLWAQAFDSPLDRMSRDLAGSLAAATEAQVHVAEMERSRRERPESLEAYDLYLRGRHRIMSSRADDNGVAIGLFYRALELDPDNTLYLAGAAEALHHRTAVGWRPFGSNDRRLARELGQRGLDRADADAASLGLFGNAMFTSNEEELGGAMTGRAVEMNDNSQLALVCDGLSHMWGGSIDDAETAFTRAYTLNPTDPNRRFALGGLASVYRIRGDFEQTLVWAKRSYVASPGFASSNWNLIAASVHLGRMDDARRYLARYRAMSPDTTTDSIRRGQPFKDPSRIAPLLEGLRLAGLPER